MILNFGIFIAIISKNHAKIENRREGRRKAYPPYFFAFKHIGGGTE